MSTSKNLNLNIIVFRRRKGMNQSQLGQKIGVTQVTVSRWERGADSPSEDHIESLCRELGVSRGELDPIGNVKVSVKSRKALKVISEQLDELEAEIARLRSFESLGNEVVKEFPDWLPPEFELKLKRFPILKKILFLLAEKNDLFILEAVMAVLGGDMSYLFDELERHKKDYSKSSF